MNKYWLTRTFLDKQRVKACAASYQDTTHAKETPSEYMIQKLNLIETCYNIMSPTEIIREIQGGMPSLWLPTLVWTDMCKMVEEFQNLVKFHQDNLLMLAHPSTQEHAAYGRFAEISVEEGPEYCVDGFYTQQSANPPRLEVCPNSNQTKDRGKAIDATKTPSDIGARTCRHFNGDHWDFQHQGQKNDDVARVRPAWVELDEV